LREACLLTLYPLLFQEEQALFDALESRRLLAVDLSGGGTLHIDTGRGDDEIEVCVEDDEITVQVNGEDEETFDFDNVERIRFAAGQGDDVVDVCEDVEVEVVVEGGKGDDTITTSSGDDRVEGGPGDDVIDTGDGDDRVEGGPGR
jgi:serralysin